MEIMKMPVNEKYGVLAAEESIDKAAAALGRNGIKVFVVESAAEAREKVLELVPQGAEVFALTSKTLGAIGIAAEINESGKYDSIRKKLNSMDRTTQGKEMRRLGAAPDWAIGSVHAVTEDGKVFVASGTGSQLPAYAYGAGKVIWVVGTQKIVRDMTEALRRMEEYSLPLEDERIQTIHGAGAHSSLNKVLIIHKEGVPGRITLIFVKEKLGF